jgi:hypothetical protein
MSAVESPDWFVWAIGQQAAVHDLEVAGCRIRMRTWGEPGRPGLVFAHGGAAHRNA